MDPFAYRLVSSLARAVAAARHGRALHPAGRTFTATLDPLPGAPRLGVPALDGPAGRPVVVRLSRALSLPPPLPDGLGLALRIPGGGDPGDLDLLFTTGGRPPAPPWLPYPVLDFAAGFYSTLLPYRSRLGRVRLLAVPVDRRRRLSGDPGRVAAVPAAVPAGAAPAGPLEFVLGLDGAVRAPLARLRLHGPVPPGEEVAAFDPIRNAHPGLRPTGAVQRARAAAYAGSQQGRSAAGRKG
ncbi:hypothetical protein Sru01_49750 [Sphaerisporangium rufum]|uniref:Phosphodiesterase n=1 Tax=Sphaerisporangium rufum TaxID=1381558 RepID=A0A919V3E7_9ACTN|nr:hypothetical protein [Sphaerisporangium rufum]GII79993.1 hypothetical protein Sru01_49750 [Sphaerisporangium rufum]